MDNQEEEDEDLQRRELQGKVREQERKLAEQRQEVDAAREANYDLQNQVEDLQLEIEALRGAAAEAARREEARQRQASHADDTLKSDRGPHSSGSTGETQEVFQVSDEMQMELLQEQRASAELRAQLQELQEIEASREQAGGWNLCAGERKMDKRPKKTLFAEMELAEEALRKKHAIEAEKEKEMGRLKEQISQLQERLPKEDSDLSSTFAGLTRMLARVKGLTLEASDTMVLSMAGDGVGNCSQQTQAALLKVNANNYKALPSAGKARDRLKARKERKGQAAED